MFHGRSRFRVPRLLAMLPLLLGGCGQARFPTSPLPPAGGLTPAAAQQDTRTRPDPAPRRVAVDEAKEALMAVLTGEQVHLQRFGTYVMAADAAAIRSILRVDLGEFDRRWEFSVHDVTENSFVATARGRNRTKATGIVVTMQFVLRGSLVWTVE